MQMPRSIDQLLELDRKLGRNSPSLESRRSRRWPFDIGRPDCLSPGTPCKCSGSYSCQPTQNPRQPEAPHLIPPCWTRQRLSKPPQRRLAPELVVFSFDIDKAGDAVAISAPRIDDKCPSRGDPPLRRPIGIDFNVSDLPINANAFGEILKTRNLLASLFSQSKVIGAVALIPISFLFYLRLIKALSIIFPLGISVRTE